VRQRDGVASQKQIWLLGPHSLWQASSNQPLAGISKSSQKHLCLFVATQPKADIF
jgi:hypothetical protein